MRGGGTNDPGWAHGRAGELSEDQVRTGRRVPVWLFAPTGRDAALLRSGLPRGDGLRVARDEDDLARGLAEPGEVGVLVMTQEALSPATVSLLKGHSDTQPPWAEMPIVLLVDPVGNTTHALRRFQDALPRTKVLVLQRPVRLSELGAAVEAMRRSRQRQHEVRDYVTQQERLRRELNHRVKNILATVQALYGLTVRTAADLEGFDAVFQPRLAAMARVHEVLFAADYGQVELGALVDAVLAPLAGDERLEASGPALRMPAEAGQSVALVLHELATNASKYGALTKADGRVALSWSGGPDVTLCWAEAGGPAVEAPTRRGYGMSFVDATVRTLGGKARWTYEADGLRFETTLPALANADTDADGDDAS